MTGDVAQVFLDDAHWDATLSRLHAALCVNGTFAFESRNPDARAWERWDRETTYERVESPYGPIECWLDVVGVERGPIRFVGHNVCTMTGEDVIVNSELRFRSQAELTHSLLNAGFAIERVYGDWDHGPMTTVSQIMVFVARRNQRPVTQFEQINCAHFGCRPSPRTALRSGALVVEHLRHASLDTARGYAQSGQATTQTGGGDMVRAAR